MNHRLQETRELFTIINHYSSFPVMTGPGVHSIPEFMEEEDDRTKLRKKSRRVSSRGVHELGSSGR